MVLVLAWRIHVSSSNFPSLLFIMFLHLIMNKKESRAKVRSRIQVGNVYGFNPIGEVGTC